MTEPLIETFHLEDDQEETDHGFCADCYPEYDPPASLCGVPMEENEKICLRDCGHAVCSICRQLLYTHKCVID